MHEMQSSTPRHSTPDVERVIRLAEVMHRTGLARTTIYDMISRNEFPSGFPIGARAVGWLASEIADFIAVRAAARQSD
jgi:prophage regulatory protein